MELPKIKHDILTIKTVDEIELHEKPINLVLLK
uniref:Uncharacterized protein n=1 Tax=Rhizophora mucronata TaxID=61149 RepID=A0A2P2Q1V6_RHIMU